MVNVRVDINAYTTIKNFGKIVFIITEGFGKCLQIKFFIVVFFNIFKYFDNKVKVVIMFRNFSSCAFAYENSQRTLRNG